MGEHRWAVVNGVRLHYVEAGAGPLVVLLHGFPEFWYAWRHQIPSLAEAGYRVLAPDLRGYNDSAKPAGVRGYRLSALVDDVVGLIAHAGSEPITLVGHDWGGVIAWRLAMARPELLTKLVILNAPHPAAFFRELRRSAQLLRSLYILFFQLPALPEWALTAGDFALLARMWRRQPVNSDAFTPHDIALYKKALARPGALTAALNYYRALLHAPGELRRDVQRIAAPTLLIWGERDPYLSVALSTGLETWIPNLRVVRLSDASHWVQNDAPQRVNHLLLDFLRSTIPPLAR
jgi:epoxide hydrolase 4